MYRIKLKNNSLIDDYLTGNKFMEEVGKLMRSYLTKDAWRYEYWGRHYVTLRVEPDSVTYRFLDKYSQGEYLKRLLAGDFKTQAEIIKEVYQGMPDARHAVESLDKCFIPISKRRNDRRNDPDTEIDDFNSIIRSLFETQLYEGADERLVHLDKNTFVSNLGLRVCPYCGRAYIFSVLPKRNGQTVKVKAEIDHFLPKSQFPFLAVNFYNMIPSCTSCNMKPAKGEQSPLIAYDQDNLKIMQPYQFEDKAITFGYNVHEEAPYDPSMMEVKVDYHGNDVLKQGYNDFFFIDALYKKHNIEAHKLYVRMKTYMSKAEIAYKSLEVDDDYWEMLPELFLGYVFSDEAAAIHPLYKFNHDIYQQLSDDFDKGNIR